METANKWTFISPNTQAEGDRLFCEEDAKMSLHLYEMSSKLLGVTVGKMHDNLTSVMLAASVFTLTVGYISKLLLKQSSEKGQVS